MMAKQSRERELRFAEGETVLEQGDPGDTMYILREGSLSVREDGVHLGTISEPGTIVGEMSCLLDKPRLADLVAETDVRLTEVAEPETWLLENPERCLGLLRTLAARLHDMDERFLEVRRALIKKGGRPAGEKSKLTPELEPFRRILRGAGVKI